MATPRLIPRLALIIAFLWAASNSAEASQHRHSLIKPSIPNGHWIDTWTSMPQLTEPANLPPALFNQTNLVFSNTTIRQTVYVSVGTQQIRIRISNAFGTTNLPITAVTVALPANGAAGSSAIQPSTLQTVTFSNSTSFIIPNGALAVSDPVDFPIEPQSMVTVTMYLAQGQQSNYITSHPGSRTTSWFSFGNLVNETNMTESSRQSVAHCTFAIVGDSITDGRGSDTDSNNRWPDLVLAKMQKNANTSKIAVVNQAAGGNRILQDGLGPNALGRIDRDVLAQSGVKYAMIFEGVNDIGTADTTIAAQKLVGDQLISAFEQIITRVHTFGTAACRFGVRVAYTAQLLAAGALTLAVPALA